jgi:hypothetical protein
MALGKHHEEILMRRRENGARIVDEFLYPQETSRRPETPYLFDLSPERFAEIRALFQRISDEAEERLAREMTLVFGVNTERTRFWSVGYLVVREELPSR